MKFQMTLTREFLLVLSVMLSACEQTASQPSEGTAAETPSVPNSDSINVKPTNEAPGLTNVSIDFPAGSLSIAEGAEIFVEEAALLQQQGVLADVGIAGGAKVDVNGA